MRVHLLRSPTGGGRRSRASTTDLVSALGAAGHEVVDVTGNSPEASSATLRQVIADGDVERVLVCGGDGLVHLAIQELAETGVPIALCPSGSGNDFATALGIDAGTVDRVTAAPDPVDLMKVTDPRGSISWVASIAIAGFPASINARANGLRLPLGGQIYTLATILELPHFQRVELSLRLDGEVVETDTAMLAIGNTSLFGGGMVACPDATPVDGLLHLTSIQGVGRLEIVRHLVGRSGGTADRPEVLRRTATRIDVDTVGIDMRGDGEPIGITPLSFEATPGALLVAGLQGA